MLEHATRVTDGSGESAVTGCCSEFSRTEMYPPSGNHKPLVAWLRVVARVGSSRAWHGMACNGCGPVQVFDHFCPWVGNAIGKHNRHLFIIFITCMLVALLGAYGVGLGRLAQTGFFTWGPRHRHRLTPAMKWSLIWLICNIPLLFTVVGLAVAQGVQVCAMSSSSLPCCIACGGSSPAGVVKLWASMCGPVITTGCGCGDGACC